VPAPLRRAMPAAPAAPPAARAPVPPVVPERSPAPILFALWLTVFAASSQVIIVSPILPDIARALAVPEAHLGWIVTAYAAALGVFALMAGPVSDRVGRRRILLYGTAAMALVLGLHVFATTFERLLVVRALAGAAGGLLSGAAVAYVGDYFPYERRGWASGWVMSGIAAGQVLGVPAGKWLTIHAGIQAPFLAFAVMTAVSALLILLRVPQPDVARSTHRLTPLAVLRGYGRLILEPGPRAAALAYVLMFAGIGLFVPYFPTWLERVVGVGGQQIALLFLAGGLTNVAAAPLAGRISDRIGRKPVVLASCLLFAALMLVTTRVVTDLVTAMVFFSVAMLTVAMRLAPLQSLMTALVPPERRGILMSGAIALGQLGMAVAAGLAGVVYGTFGFAGNTLGGAVALLAMGAVVWWGLPEPGRSGKA
jgi:predicted MFS family arabinose efflux permease